MRFLSYEHFVRVRQNCVGPLVIFSECRLSTVCWDILANEAAKTRYLTGGQVSVPVVIGSHDVGDSCFGAQHSQSVENWAMMISSLKVVARSSAKDVIG